MLQGRFDGRCIESCLVYNVVSVAVRRASRGGLCLDLHLDLAVLVTGAFNAAVTVRGAGTWLILKRIGRWSCSMLGITVTSTLVDLYVDQNSHVKMILLLAKLLEAVPVYS